MLRDTSPEAEALYYRRLREMTPAERLQIGANLWEAGHALVEAQVRKQFPDADEQEILFQLCVRRYGREIACKAYGR